MKKKKAKTIGAKLKDFFLLPVTVSNIPKKLSIIISKPLCKAPGTAFIFFFIKKPTTAKTTMAKNEAISELVTGKEAILKISSAKRGLS